MTFTVPIRIDAPGQDAAIRKVTDELDRMERAGKAAGEIVSKLMQQGRLHADQAAEATKRYAKALAEAERAAEQTAAAAHGLGGGMLGQINGAIGGLTSFIGELGLAGGAIGGFVGGLASAAEGLASMHIATLRANDGLIQMRNQLRNATDGQDELNRAMAMTRRIADDTSTDVGVTRDAFARVARVTDTLGFSLERTGRFSETLQKMFAASGRSSGEASTAMLQFSQALGSGVLQGDEFRSINESMPALLDAFAARLGVTKGELKKLASEGKITTDVMIGGIEDMAARADVAFAQMEKTFAQRLQPMANAVTDDPLKFKSNVYGSANLDPEAMKNMFAMFEKAPDLIPGVESLANQFGIAFEPVKISEFNRQLGQVAESLKALQASFADNDSSPWAHLAEAPKFTGDILADLREIGVIDDRDPMQKFNAGLKLIPARKQMIDDLASGFGGLRDMILDVSDVLGDLGTDSISQASGAVGAFVAKQVEEMKALKSWMDAAGRWRTDSGRSRGKSWEPDTNYWGAIAIDIKNAAANLELFDVWAGEAEEHFRFLLQVAEMQRPQSLYDIAKPPAGGGGLGAPAAQGMSPFDPNFLNPANEALKNRTTSNYLQDQALKRHTEQWKEFEKASTQALSHVEDAFVRLFTTGKFGAEEMFSAIMTSLTRMATHKLLTGLLGAALGPGPGIQWANGQTSAYSGSLTGIPTAAHGGTFRIGGSSTVGDRVPLLAMVNSGEDVTIRSRFQQQDAAAARPVVNVRAVVQEGRRSLLDMPGAEEDIMKVVFKHRGKLR